VQQSFLSLAEFGFAGPQKALGVLQDSLATVVGDDASFNSGHGV